KGATAELAAMQRLAKRALVVGNTIHIAGQGLMAGQWIVIPIALYKEIEDIDKEEQSLPSPDHAKYRARRLEAWARALKSGVVQVRTMQLQSDPTAGYDPFRESTQR